MSLQSPWTWTVNAVDRVLNRILGPERRNNGEIISTYANSDESTTLIVTHSPSPNRVRHRVRLVDKKVTIDADTSLPVGNPPSLTLEFVIDRPIYGYTVAEIQALVASMKTEVLIDAIVAQLHGKES